jgi:AcrR family transcriptional regulator
MIRPSTITTEQILDAAREVFLEKGIQATTAEVARRADVAEGSIFKRFRTKHELFRRAMEPTVQDPEFLRMLPQRVGNGDLRRHLFEFGTEMLAFMRRLMPLMMMSWSNRKCGLPKHLSMPDPPPVRAVRRIAAFFEAEMRRKRLRRHDPEILARVFVGSVQNYVFLELLLKAHHQPSIPAEEYLRGLVHLIWTGAAPAKRKESSP